MKTLYVQCASGIAGNMLAAALYELAPDRAAAEKAMRAALPEKAEMTLTPTERRGVLGTYLSLTAPDEGHVHRTLGDVYAVIDSSAAPDAAKNRAKAVYARIARAEAQVHGTDETHVHFHEVGSLPAITGVLLSCLLFNTLAPDRTVFSAVNLGGGSVKCAHGTLPVPAPAVAELAKGMPAYGSDAETELCTVTGAALAAELADAFGNMPALFVRNTGCGAGKRDLPRANVLRAFVGEEAEEETVALICCNLDDMTGEEIGFACERLMAEGALDVWTAPVQMKKGRPAYTLFCLCRSRDEDKFVGLVFRHTLTAGVRIHTAERRTLARQSEILTTPYGEMRFKTCRGYGAVRRKAEADDVARAALAHDLPFFYVSDNGAPS